MRIILLTFLKSILFTIFCYFYHPSREKPKRGLPLFTTSHILTYIFLGAAAFAYMVYGKQQKKAVAMLSGIGLAVIPYFGFGFWYMTGISVLLLALPFLLRF